MLQTRRVKVWAEGGQHPLCKRGLFSQQSQVSVAWSVFKNKILLTKNNAHPVRPIANYLFSMSRFVCCAESGS